MATKRSGGSNIGLIVTLVFFVLLSVIVSVLAYMGFDGQAKLKTEKDKAVADAKNAEKRRDWYRFQAQLYRSYMGHPVTAKTDLDRVNEERRQFEGGSLPFAEGEDLAEVTSLIKEKLAGGMPWTEKSDAPGTTFEQRLRDKDAEIARIAKLAQDDVATEQGKTQKAQDDLKAAQAVAEKVRTDIKSDADKGAKDLQAFISGTNTKIDTYIGAVKDLEGVRKDKQALEDGKKKVDKSVKALQARIDTLTKDLRTTRDELEDTRTRLAALAERSGIDTRVMAAELLDASAARVLANWKRDWQIVAMDRKGTMPYINLGTSDGLRAQVTFSVHSRNADGKLNPTPKATVEVIRLMGPKQAQVRVTSIKDAKADPILKGDRLFNPTWDPSRRKHVAIAGLVDMGDGADGTEEFRKLLKLQSVDVDAYIDTKDEKAPRLLAGDKRDGKEVAGAVTSNTDYLILADTLDQVKHAKAGSEAYKKAFAAHIKSMKDQATANGVPVIALKKYLEMIGYRPSKVVQTGTGR